MEIKNITAYSYEVARLIFLETTKSESRKTSTLESVKSDLVVGDSSEQFAENELRMQCLDDCLATLPRESRELIMEYYQHEEHGQVERRRALADRFGIRRDALANRVQRLRDKLEHCVSVCLRKKSAI